MLPVARHVLFLALAFILQSTWIHHLQVAGVMPDLVLMVVVFVALISGPLEATVLGFLAGLCQDAYSPPDLGLNALAKSLVGFGVGATREGLLADTVQVQVGVLVAAVLVHDLIYYIGASSTSFEEVPGMMFRFSLGRALYTGLIGLIAALAIRLRRRVIAD